MAFDGRFKLMIGRLEKTDGLACCDTGMQCIRPSHDTIDSDYTAVPCGVDSQGFDAPGVDALYDLHYDAKVSADADERMARAVLHHCAALHGKPPSKGGSHLLRVTAADGKVGSAFLELRISVE